MHFFSRISPPKSKFSRHCQGIYSYVYPTILPALADVSVPEFGFHFPILLQLTDQHLEGGSIAITASLYTSRNISLVKA